MNKTAFKSRLTWRNIGEVAVVAGIFALSVWNSALSQLFKARQSVRVVRPVRLSLLRPGNFGV